jgi:hypothetical protein
MGIKRFLTLVLVLSATIAAFPVAGHTADSPENWTVYFRPAVRFGTDDRTLYIMDFLVPLYQGEKDILFFNPKFTPNDADGWETNLGIGYRHLLLKDKLMLGANVFYDTRRTPWGTYWDQVGVGAEAMTEINKYAAFTGRFNYYIPLTDPIVGGGGFGDGYIFKSLGIYSVSGGAIEEAPEGFDAEVGYRIPFISDYVETWVYVGGYHYKGKYVDDIDGWSARLEVIPTDFVRVGYEYREDRTNRGEHHGEVALEIPFSVGNLFAGKNPFEGFGRRLSGSRELKERLVEPVRRDVDIVVVTEDAGAGGAFGGLAEPVVFVNETATAGDPINDGTYEHPFATVQEAMDAINDPVSPCFGITTVHVMNDDPGAGTAGGGVVNLAAMMIWGSGMPHPTFGAISNDFAGYPTIDSTLFLNGNDDDAFGMYLAAGTGIENTADTLIHNNGFLNNNFGIVITGGSPAIDSNTFSGIPGNGVLVNDGSPFISNNVFVGGSADIYFNAGPGGTVSGNALVGASYGIYTNPAFGGTLSVTDNTFDGNSTGLIADGGAAFTVTGNTFDGNDTGVQFFDGTLTATGNTLTCDTYGFYLGTISPILVDDNGITVTGTGNAVGIYFTNTNADATITDNVIAILNADGSAGGIAFDACGDIDATITGNVMDITNAGDYSGGIAAFDGTGGVDVVVSGNTVRIDDPGGDAGGIVFDTTGGTIAADIGDNTVTISDALGAAVGIGLSSTSDVMAHIDGNDLTGGVTGSGVSVTGLFSDEVAGIGIESGGSIMGPAGLSLISNNLLGGTGIAATGGAADAYGIYLDTPGDIGVLGAHALISDNLGINVGAVDGWATGIYAYGENILADVTNNDGMSIVAGNGFGFGVQFLAGRYVGATIAAPDPILVSGNDYMTVSSPNANGYGIALYGMDYLLAGITDNTNLAVSGRGDQPIFLTPWTGNAGIVAVSPGGGVGLGGGPFADALLISGNTVTVNSDFDAIGIFGFADDTIEATAAYGGGILNNLVTANSTGGTGGNAAGIILDSYGTGTYMDIAGNTLTALAPTGEADGVLGLASGYLIASVTGGSIGANGNVAYGIGLETAGDSGGIDMDAYISVPTIAVTGGDLGVAFGIELYADLGSINASIADTGITAGLDPAATGGGSIGIDAYVERYLEASVTGGSISASGFGADGIYFETWGDDGSGLGLKADISVPTIYVAGNGEGASGYYAAGIELYAEGGDMDVTVNGVTSLAVDSTNASADGGEAYGILASTAFDLYADITDNSRIAVSGDDNAYGIYLEGLNIVGPAGGHALLTGNGIAGAAPGFTVNSINGSAAGILLLAADGILADVTDNGTGTNPLTVTGPGCNPIVDPLLTGGDFTGDFGILALSDGSIGGTGDHSVIDNNYLSVSSGLDGYNAYGILGLAPGNIYTDVTNNAFSVEGPGGLESFPMLPLPEEYSFLGGITLVAGNDLGDAGGDLLIAGNAGTVRQSIDLGDPIIIDPIGILLLAYGDIHADTPGGGGIAGNMLNVNASDTAPDPAFYRKAVGINAVSFSGSVFASITGNLLNAGTGITAGITGYRAEGIYLGAWGDIGNLANPVTISGNQIIVRGNTTVIGSFYNYGIGLESTGDIVAFDPGIGRGGIYENTLTVYNNQNRAYGIYLYSDGGNVGSTIRGNTATVQAGYEAWGIYEEAASLIYSEIGYIVGGTYPDDVNTVSVTAENFRYFLEVYSGAPGTGNYVDWGGPGGNTYTPYGGSGLWSGNYDIGGYVFPGPIQSNLSYPGEITP